MITYHITGGQTLSGHLKIAGRKNAALPLIAASLLTTGTLTLKNVPDIVDVRVMLDILAQLGATVKQHGSTVSLNTSQVANQTIPHDLGRQLRGSILLLGPLAARFGRLTMPYPGGCIIGKRPVGLHITLLERMGATFTSQPDEYAVTGPVPLAPTQFFLEEASVTTTENGLMAAALAGGQTTLVNAATEDHVTQLADVLTQLGFIISGQGSATLVIEGTHGQLSDKDLTVTVIPDEIELGTFITAAVVTRSQLQLTQVGTDQQTLPIRAIFERFGVNLRYDAAAQTLTVNRTHKLRPANFKTGTWPGVPTDLQPPLALLATQINGNTLIHDWMYEGRFVYVNNLEKMGAVILNCDPHRILVQGATPLRATNTVSPDLRAGATQLIAALAATGESTLEHAEQIERGYEQIVERLQAVGATISRTAQ